MAEKPGDFNLPPAVVAKLIKDALPNDVTVSKDARAVLGKAASIFVLYSTAYASKIAAQSDRNQLTAQDVVEATDRLGFHDFVPSLKQVYQANKRSKDRANKMRREKRQAKQSLLATGDHHQVEEDDDDVQCLDDEDEDEKEDQGSASYEIVFE